MFDIRRRDVIALIGGAAACPFAARAQQPTRMRRIAVLMGGAESDPQARPYLAAFDKSLRELGWADGRTVQIDYRYGAGDLSRMRTFAKELVSLHPDVIVGHTTPGVAALQHETKTIPIVFVVVSDPVGSGLPRPGGNITGFINIESSLAGKWIELLKDIVPHIARAGLMFNPETAPYADYYLRPFLDAARSYGLQSADASVRNAEEIDRVVETFASKPGSTLAIMTDVFLTIRDNLTRIISSAARFRVPIVYPYRFMVAAGGLISYGVDNSDLFRRSASYVDRLLKGANPADLPVQLPTKFELAVNLKTAKSLGLEIPAMVLGRADEVIE